MGKEELKGKDGRKEKMGTWTIEKGKEEKKGKDQIVGTEMERREGVKGSKKTPPPFLKKGGQEYLLTPPPFLETKLNVYCNCLPDTLII